MKKHKILRSNIILSGVHKVARYKCTQLDGGCGIFHKFTSTFVVNILIGCLINDRKFHLFDSQGGKNPEDKKKPNMKKKTFLSLTGFSLDSFLIA